MMIEFAPFHPDDIDALDLDPAMAIVRVPALRETLARASLAETCRCDGRPVACAGINPLWDGVANAWALFGRAPAMPWRAITRRVIAQLNRAQAQGFHRIQATVDPACPPACRWLLRLGFAAEGVFERYTPDGRDMIAVARVSKGVATP